MSVHVGVNGAVRDVNALHVGVNGAVHEVQAGYCGVNGVVRQFYQKEVYTTFSIVVSGYSDKISNIRINGLPAEQAQVVVGEDYTLSYNVSDRETYGFVNGMRYYNYYSAAISGYTNCTDTTVTGINPIIYIEVNRDLRT